MEFIDREIKCNKIQKTDKNGLPLTEAFYALISDEVTQEGTVLNADVMNKGNWRDDNSISFSIKHDEPLNPQPNATQIYTASDGETWLVPPEGYAESYQLSAGHKALNTLRDPTTGRKNNLQNIINNSINIFTNPCTAIEYDNSGLTADEYGKKNIKALDYDVCGALTLKGSGGNSSGYSIFDLRDPTTGQKGFLQDIINNLFNLFTLPLTVAEYEAKNFSAIYYDNIKITAINFDMRGRALLI